MVKYPSRPQDKEESMMLRSPLIVGIAWMCILGTGCPHDWMKEGTNDRAMRRDMEEEVEELRQAAVPCPEGQSRVKDCPPNAEGKPICHWVCR